MGCAAQQPSRALLQRALGPAFDAREPNMSVTAIGDNLEAFEDLIRKLQRRRIDPTASEPAATG
jgi:hypothetical protein